MIMIKFNNNNYEKIMNEKHFLHMYVNKIVMRFS